MKRYTLRSGNRFDFEDYIAESEEEAVSEAKKIWGNRKELAVYSVSEDLDKGVNSKCYCPSYLNRLRDVKEIDYRGAIGKVMCREKLFGWQITTPEGCFVPPTFSNYKDEEDCYQSALEWIDKYIEINGNCPIGLGCSLMCDAQNSLVCPNREVCNGCYLELIQG